MFHLTRDTGEQAEKWKHLVWIAPLFFLIKGLMWLAIPVMLVLWGTD